VCVLNIFKLVICFFTMCVTGRDQIRGRFNSYDTKCLRHVRVSGIIQKFI